ncbi:MAG: hypothetical protein NT154_15435 [Verrucomicrobia bacterium]|nr:hypothetical protein [Verrucomicrobiota bacterium]
MPAAMEQQRQACMAKLSDAKRLILGMLMYADDYTNQFLTDLKLVEPYLGANGVTGTNQFELVYNGSLGALNNRAFTIVVRERQPWQRADGGWYKTYGFADGHSELHLSPDGNFEEWEKERMVFSLPKVR